MLGRHSHKFCGVLNGIDQHMWSPSDDPLLPPWGHYSANDTRGKAVCKAALLGELGMPHTDPATAEGALCCTLLRTSLHSRCGASKQVCVEQASRAVCKAALLGELVMPHTDPASAEGAGV